ncbi:hypothetical protein [Streptomyces chartreusis]|uniref:hypothetical protein n=1 Tax=Streptomyces chartreusis TaxID=1969 RepID=UPI003805DCAF
MDGLGWIGSFHAVPMPFRTQAQVVPVDLMVPVTSEQVLALEKYRDGQDLAVLLEVEGTLPQSAAYPFAHIQQERSVPAGIWEHQIRTLGLAVSFSISVPWPAAGGPLAAAAGHLRTADQQITAGDYPDAIRETRLAVDAMRALKIWPKNGSRKRSGQDQAEGYAILLDRLADQAGGHAEPARALLGRASGPQPSDGVIGSGSWVRSDAIALNGMAASLLHRLAEEGC